MAVNLGEQAVRLASKIYCLLRCQCRIRTGNASGHSTNTLAMHEEMHSHAKPDEIRICLTRTARDFQADLFRRGQFVTLRRIYLGEDSP